MASLLDKLVNAGLQPLDAQEVVTMLGDGFAFPLDRKALIQSARRGWWASEKVSNSYKRLLDATLARSDESAGEIDIIKAWHKQLLRLADADLLTDDLGLLALGRQVEMVGGALPDLSLDAVIKAYQVIEDGVGKQLIAAYLDSVLGAEIIKGGEGSGNHGHAGIPGQQGGSMPTGNDEGPALQDSRFHLSGDIDKLADFRLTPDDLVGVMETGVDGVVADVTVSYDKLGNNLDIKGTWKDEKGTLIGEVERRLFDEFNHNEVRFESLSFESTEYMNRGIGKRVAHQWFQMLGDKGYEQAKMLADMTIGRYAWAKEGAQYDDGGQGYMAEDATAAFKDWVAFRNIPDLGDDDMPTFENPQDVANYQHPTGYKLTGSDIDNIAVPPDMEMDLGKAFMLDTDVHGHGNWEAVIELSDWKERSRAHKSLSVDDLIQPNETHFVDAGYATPGASDALFFAQYLSEDEGEPIFGFVEPSMRERGGIIKGGEGSGNHGHRGIPGHQGGSKPSGKQKEKGKLSSTFGVPKAVAHEPDEILFELFEVEEGFPHGDYDEAMSIASRAKDDVVSRLSEAIGIKYSDANEFIKTWSESSNDGDLRALGMQKAASELFGIPLSEWQANKLNRLLKNRQSVIDGMLQEAERRGQTYRKALSSTLDSVQQYPLAGDLWAKLNSDLRNGVTINSKEDAVAWLRKADQDGIDRTKAALTFIYNETQAAFEKAGITEVVAYRGSNLPNSIVGGLIAGDMLEHTSNALSSWSLSKSVVDYGFMDVQGGDTNSAVGLHAIVPVERIVSFPITGFGSMPEWEIIVLGNAETDSAQVYEINGNKRGKIIKGGPGSGNFGHDGRPGERGGSAPGDGKDYSKELELNGGRIKLTGRIDKLSDFRLTPEDLAEIMDIGVDGSTASAYIAYRDNLDSLKIVGTWRDADGNTIGEFDRMLFAHRNEVKLESLSFVSKYMGKGLGTRAAEQWFQKLADKGYETALMLADLEVGRYAWAKEGAQYDDGDDGYTKARVITRKFKQWADHHNISAFDDGDYPIFENPQDVANYKHPSGYKLSGKDIKNPEVPANMQMDLGKAFMLDQDDITYGHGSWDAVINLKNWKGRGHAYKAITVDDLIGGDDKTHYVDVGADIPGGSDSLFWSQYLSEDEGEPMFGFAQVSTSKSGNKRSDIIKGGPGSGNHGHAGIVGHQGGSKPTGRDATDDPKSKQLVEEMVGGRNLASMRPAEGYGHVAVDERLITVIHGNDKWGYLDDPGEEGAIHFAVANKREIELKAAVSEALASDIGLSPAFTSDFIKDWAVSSNDTYLPSLMHQKMAAKHFGTNLSEWQEEKFKSLLALREKEVHEFVNDLFDGKNDRPLNASLTLQSLSDRLSDRMDSEAGNLLFPFERGVIKKMTKGDKLGMIANKSEAMALIKEAERQIEAVTEKAVASVYARTQKVLADAGITELTLYRGSILPNRSAGGAGDVLVAKMNSLSSWSAHEYTAEAFFGHQDEGDYLGGSDAGTTGVVVDANIPASRVYSLPTTGVGCLEEWEVIIVGSSAPDSMRIKTTYKDERKTARKAFIKGGEGSGNHGHAGIVGHQGGSKPTGNDSAESMTNNDLVESMIKPKGRTVASLRPHDGSDDVAANEKLLSLLHDNDDWQRVATNHKDTDLRRYSAVVGQDEALKDIVNRELAKELGMSPSSVNDFTYDWSLSSNDSHLPSLMHQRIAAEYFGTNLSDWQKEKIKSVKSLRKKEIDNYVDDLFGGWSNDPVNASHMLNGLRKQMDDSMDGKQGSILLPFEEGIIKKMVASGDLGMLNNKQEVKALLKKIERQSKALTKKAMKSVYARTQKKLADAGITEMLLYRGTILPSGGVGEEGTVMNLASNALSSWSASEYTADIRFAKQHERDYLGKNSTTGVVLSAVVPASRIYSIPSTGHGTLPEWEVILIGGSDPEPMFIKTTYKDERRTV